MSNLKLSILIPTVNDRKDKLESLLHHLAQQCQEMWPGYYYGFISSVGDPSFHGIKGDQVEIIYCPDDRQMSIGEKRSRLYSRANGLYSWQIDDDDDISINALALIAKAIKEAPDCITFNELCHINGQSFIANHGLKYDDWADKQDGYDHVRTPYFKDVIKTEIAQKVPVPHSRYGEDHAWSRLLKPHLKTEVHLDEVIYIYQHNSKPHEHAKRYGFDKD